MINIADLWRRVTRAPARVVDPEVGQQFRILFHISPVVMSLTRFSDGRFLDVNRAFEELTGWKRDEVIGRTTVELGLWNVPEEHRAMRQGVEQKGSLHDIEWQVRRRDGEVRDVLVSIDTVDYRGERSMLITAMDITARKQIEQRTQRLNRLLRTLTAINPRMLRAASPSQLFADLCRTLVEQGGFSMAWAGMAEPNTSRVQIAAQAGYKPGYLENLDLRYDDSASGRGPTGTAIRTGRTAINEDTETNEQYVQWRGLARELGYRSSIALPLQVEGRVIGSLNVYAAQPYAFGSEEVVLLEKFCGDAGVAVERMQAIARIERSEHELATILHNMQDTYYRTDLEGCVVRASESATQLLGYSPQEVLGLRLGDFYVDPDGRGQFLAALQAGGGKVQNFEAALRHRNGTAVWVSTNAQYVLDAAGRVVGIEGTTRDITERKRSERNLLDIARGVSARTGETFFQSLVEHLARTLQADIAFVGELLPDQTSRVRTIAFLVDGQRVSNFEYELAGTPCETVIGRETCAYPADVQRQFPEDHMLAKMGIQAYVGTPLFSAGGAALGLVAVLFRNPIESNALVASTLEIFAIRAGVEMERLRSEDALRSSELRYRTIVETAQEGIWMIDADSRTTFVNSKMASMLGYSVDEMLGRLLFDFMDEEGRTIAAAGMARRKRGVAEQVDVKYRRKDGTVMWGTVSATPLKNEQGQYAGSLAMIADITERHRTEQALRDSEAMLAKAQEVARIGSWWWDIPANRLICSRELLNLYGFPPGLAGSAADIFAEILQTVHPEDRDHFEQTMQQLVTTGTTADTIEYRIVLPDGRERTLLVYPEVVRDAGGRPLATYGAVQDITERKQAEQALRESEFRYRQLFENMTSGFALHEIICDDDGNPVDYRYLQANPAFERLTGVPIATLIGKRIREIMPNTEDYWIQVFGKVALTGQSMAYENFSRELGKYYDTWVFSPQKNQFAVIFTDITQRKVAEAEMHKLSGAVEQTADAVIITSRAGVIEYVNPAFERVTGYTRAETTGHTPRLVKSGKHDDAYYRRLWQTILAGEVFSDVLINRRKDGSLYYEEKTITPLKDATGQITHFISTGKDVTERMQTQERLQYLAQHDALTGLPNRVLLLDRLTQSMARARWHRRLVAVLFIDLDRFKNINDTLGHEFGDRLLTLLGERFSRHVREGDTVARFGGDEFVMLLDDLASDKDVGVVAQKVLDTLKAPFSIDGHNLYLTASIGVSLFPGDGEDASLLLKNADIAMYRAKELGKNTYQFYSSDMSARAFERLSLETSLRHALERGEFRLYYQPQFDTESSRIVALEALLRWQHPDFGLVSPGEFISLLEETGLIVPVGDWVLATASAQLRQWNAQGWKDVRVAVNLSPRQFQSSSVMTSLESSLARLDFPAGLLEIEITEGMLVQHAGTTLETLDTLRKAGVRLAIDDFGTGYSSLSYLRRFPIDTLKIDRSFVRDIPADPDDSAITTAIAALATSLKLDMVAEGVETEAQRDFLRSLGCRVMQGYLFSVPLPPEEILPLLERHNRRG